MNGNEIKIRPAHESELTVLYDLITLDTQWVKFNGPYFGYKQPSLKEFKDTTFKRLLEGRDMQLVIFNGVPLGSVNCYWECEATRWLEAGIVIYDSSKWGLGVASKAIPQWIDFLFANYEIERVGMTTWSGNPRMVACASKIGLQQEARLRKVRYFEGAYYDSIKFGILRSEWESCN